MIFTWCVKVVLKEVECFSLDRNAVARFKINLNSMTVVKKLFSSVLIFEINRFKISFDKIIQINWRLIYTAGTECKVFVELTQ